jgi:hypothetical protein
MRIVWRTLLFVVILGCIATVETKADECMDCGVKRTQRFTSTGDPIWPVQSSALCCDFPCVGGYEMRDENVGWGCRTCSVNNSTVTGSICCSSTDDLNCPTGGGGGGGGGGGFNDDTGCKRDTSGACPPECASCL